MGDVPYPVEPEPTKAEKAAARVNATVRGAIAGDPAGSLRRPILFIIAAVGLLVGWPLSIIGLVALVLLAVTDQVVAL